MNYLETWAEMEARHKREKIEALESLSQSGFTQTEAASILRTDLTTLNNWVRRLGIEWKTKKQGQNQHVTKRVNSLRTIASKKRQASTGTVRG